MAKPAEILKRVGLAAVAVYVTSMAALGAMFSWPLSCEGACGGDPLWEGSGFWAAVFVVGAVAAGAGVVLALIGQLRLGLVAAGAAVVVTAAAILL